MATTKPRLTLTLDPSFSETITRLAKLVGRSKSGVLTDYLMAMHEPLMRTVALLEAASEAPEQVRKGLREAAESVERDLSQGVEGALGQMDSLLGLARSRESFDPHVVTRGSGLTKKLKSKGLAKSEKGG